MKIYRPHTTQAPYIAGPMRGFKNFNFDAFFEVETFLTCLWRDSHCLPFNPARNDIEKYGNIFHSETGSDIDNPKLAAAGWSIRKALTDDLQFILNKADCVVCLPGWRNSQGARLEVSTALAIGLPVYEVKKNRPGPGWANGWGLCEEKVTSIEPSQTEFQVSVQKSLAPELPTDDSADVVTLRSASVAEQWKKVDGLAATSEERIRKHLEQTEDQTNPKDRLGSLKPELHLVPPALSLHTAKVMSLGAKKYGPYNWRDKKVRLTIYLSAALRHILQKLDGEDLDPESGQPHEAHAAACMGIILDARACDCLIDDRPKAGAAARLIGEMTEKKQPAGLTAA